MIGGRSEAAKCSLPSAQSCPSRYILMRLNTSPDCFCYSFMELLVFDSAFGHEHEKLVAFACRVVASAHLARACYSPLIIHSNALHMQLFCYLSGQIVYKNGLGIIQSIIAAASRRS
eukprot:6175282-Pleurochrysis_carterae.AAC.1